MPIIAYNVIETGYPYCCHTPVRRMISLLPALPLTVRAGLPTATRHSAMVLAVITPHSVDSDPCAERSPALLASL